MLLQITTSRIKRVFQPVSLTLGFASTLLLMFGCATQAPVKEVEEVQERVWPNPPEQAVIRYVDEVSEIEKLEIEDRSSFRDILAGKETKKAAQRFSKPHQ